MRNTLSNIFLWFCAMLVSGLIVLMVIYKLAWLITVLVAICLIMAIIGLPFYWVAKYKYNQYLKNSQMMYEEQRREKAFADMFDGGKS